MFEIREGWIDMHGETVPTFSRNVDLGDEQFVVEAGSRACYVDKYREEIRYTYLSLFCPTHGIVASTIGDKNGMNAGFELTACGEPALDGLIVSLEFALTVLKDFKSGNIE